MKWSIDSTIRTTTIKNNEAKLTATTDVRERTIVRRPRNAKSGRNNAFVKFFQLFILLKDNYSRIYKI